MTWGVLATVVALSPAMQNAAPPAAPARPAREITFRNNVFTLRGPEGTQQVSTIPGLRPVNPASGQIWQPVGKRVLVWGKNGLGVRANNRTLSVSLAAVATSPKLFDKAQIEDTAARLAAKTRQLEPSAISGYEVWNDRTVYLLPRWEDKDGSVWLEALVLLDLSGPTPKTRLVGRFDGFSSARGRVADKLNRSGVRLVVPTRTPERLGVASYVPAEDVFGWQPQAPAAEVAGADATLIPGSMTGITLARGPAGLLRIGQFEEAENSWAPVAELRGNVLGLYSPGLIQYRRGSERVLLNLSTGAELPVPDNCGVDVNPQGVLLWAPERNPTVAALYTHGAFRTLARWSAPARR